MLRGSARAVSPSELTNYDFLVERIADLEVEQVETRLRPEESKLRGLQQTLASYEGVLRQLHEISEQRHRRTHKAEGSFDLLGKKHKQRRVEAQREKEKQACINEHVQQERVQKLVSSLEAQREVVFDLRRKTRELDAVRQAESDLVDRLFRSDGLISENTEHGALESAVCSLAPRLFKMREAVAMYAVVSTKLDTAISQLKSAAEELEHTFEPSHKPVKDEFGDEQGEIFFDTANKAAKIQAVNTASKLLKAAAQNLHKARLRIGTLPGLQPNESSSLMQCLDPILQPGADVDTLEMRKLVRDCINTIYISESQTSFASELVLDQATKSQQELTSLETHVRLSKAKLDGHRRDLLSQVQHARRSHSLQCSEAGSLSASVSGVAPVLRAKLVRRFDSGSGMGDKVPSVNSGLSRLA